MSKNVLQSEMKSLEKNINRIGFTECRLPLMYIHETIRLELAKSMTFFKESEPHLKSVIEQLNNFIDKLNALPVGSELSKEQQEALLKELNESFKKLRQSIEKHPIKQFLKDAYHNVLAALGLALGIVLGAFFGAFMMGVGIYYGSKKYGFMESVKDTWRYFITGFAEGIIIGRRITTSAENNFDRQMRFNTETLSDSLETMVTLLDKNEMHKIEKKVLTEILGEHYTDKDKAQFLNKSHKYKLVTMQASFLSPKLQGSLGHHATLVYTSSNKKSTKQHFIAEIGSPSDEEINIIEQDAKTQTPHKNHINQRHVRHCKGHTLLNILVMHEILGPKFANGFKDTQRLFKASGYRPGYNDCQTYVDLLLSSAGEPLSTLKRVTKDENWVGKAYVHTLEALSIFSSQPQMGKAVDKENQKPRPPQL